MTKVHEQCRAKKPVYGGIVDEAILASNLQENCVADDLASMTLEDFSGFLEARLKPTAKNIWDYYYNF